MCVGGARRGPLRVCVCEGGTGGPGGSRRAGGATGLPRPPKPRTEREEAGKGVAHLKGPMGMPHPTHRQEKEERKQARGLLT